MIEIRWHGRGGQGTKSAVLGFADIVFKKENMYKDFQNMDQKEQEHLLQHITG